MESPTPARHGPFPAWTLQPDPWESKFNTSSRFSSYATKVPAYRYNEADTFRIADCTYVNWPRDGFSSPTELPWQQATVPGFPFGMHGTQRKDFADNSHLHVQSHGYLKGLLDHGMTMKQQAKQDSSTLPSSNADGIQANRAPKRHVKSACANCKRAHLSCDVLRPCTRCIQTGKTMTCVDVPQRRKGRPRLQQNSLRKSGRAGVPKTLSVKPLAAVHEHSQLTPLQNFAYHAGSSIPADHCNICSNIPMVFLGVDLKIFQTNQQFRGLFDFLGNLHGRSLEQLVETTDFGRLESVRWALRQEVDKEISMSPLPVHVVEHGNTFKTSSIESYDIFRITKPFITRRERIHFRFADNISRPVSVEFSLSKTDVYFVTLALPPIRSEAMMASSMQRQQQLNQQYNFLAAPTQSSYSHHQAFDPTRNHQGRQFDHMPLLPLPSPDISTAFSISPTSSYSLSSTASSIPASSRHASFASHRSYEQPLVPPLIGNTQAAVPYGQLESYPKYMAQSATMPHLQTPAGQSLSTSSSAHLAPLKDQAPSQINASRKLPPIPGLGSPDSQASDNAGSQATRSQQVYWQDPSQEQSAKQDSKGSGALAPGQIWQSDSPTRRTRLDVKELTA